MIQAAYELYDGYCFDWALLIQMALCTGMRRGELLNLTWQDIDFNGKTVNVSPKKDTEHVWQWHIKDSQRRKLPLTDDLVKKLQAHRLKQPAVLPYVFIPLDRYQFIQQRRLHHTWTIQDGANPMNNFYRQMRRIVQQAGIGEVVFHDLRRTCLTNWLQHGLGEFEASFMAGHSSFETTRRFYLAVGLDTITKARQASTKVAEAIFGAKMVQTDTPTSGVNNSTFVSAYKKAT
ncbi:MAG: site-specific integrase [Sedimentisphaerales bacterium]|nr:site-specific integrase [Sedimentisphaerales bacterium]